MIRENWQSCLEGKGCVTLPQCWHLSLQPRLLQQRFLLGNSGAQEYAREWLFQLVLFRGVWIRCFPVRHMREALRYCSGWEAAQMCYISLTLLNLWCLCCVLQSLGPSAEYCMVPVECLLCQELSFTYNDSGSPLLPKKWSTALQKAAAGS